MDVPDIDGTGYSWSRLLAYATTSLREAQGGKDGHEAKTIGDEEEAPAGR